MGTTILEEMKMKMTKISNSSNKKIMKKCFLIELTQIIMVLMAISMMTSRMKMMMNLEMMMMNSVAPITLEAKLEQPRITLRVMDILNLRQKLQVHYSMSKRGVPGRSH